MPENCDIFADVDFGHGLVEVRCTRVGKHESHVCEVILVQEKILGEVGYKKPSLPYSVFDATTESVAIGREVSPHIQMPNIRKKPGYRATNF